MINSFLATLDNNATAPVVPGSTFGNVVWPVFTVKTYTAEEQAARNILYANTTTRVTVFLVSVELLMLVEESVHVGRITKDSPVVTYTREQLIGLFSAVPQPTVTQIARILSSWDFSTTPGFLTGELRESYNQSMAKLDKLAAVISHFGAVSI